MKAVSRLTPSYLATVALLAVGSCLALIASSRAQTSQPLSDKTRSQIAAIQRAHEARTPAQRKIHSQLLHAASEAATGHALSTVPSLRSQVTLEADGRVKVRIFADVNPDLLAAITSLGGAVTSSFPGYRVVYATMPLPALESLAARSDVQFIADPPELMHDRPADLAAANLVDTTFASINQPQAAGPGGQPQETDTATNDPEGDATHGAAAVRQSYGVNGTGVKVGVMSSSIDDSSGSYATALSAGYISPVTVLPGQAGNSTDDGEGLAMSEVVHRIAPGASLYYATADNGEEQLAENIKALAADGCKVLVDDNCFGDESPFQDDAISQAVNTVTAQGVLYFSAAGNFYHYDSGHSSVWEGNFVSTENDGYLDFVQGTEFNYVSEKDLILNEGTGSTVTVVLFWAEPQGGATSQYNLYEVTNAGDVVQEADDDVATSKTPLQGLKNVTTGNSIAVQLASGSALFLHVDIFAEDAVFYYCTAGRTRGHNGGLNTLCCAAAPCDKAQIVGYPAGPYPNLFSGSNLLEPFSADGPRHIFFNPDGSAITPGNFSSTGGELLAKPDFTGGDGVTTSVPAVGGDGSGFYGTSCATPHAGALAALAMSYRPDATPAQIVDAMYAGCVQIANPGQYDRDSGAGILLAANIFENLPAPPAAPKISSATSASGTVDKSFSYQITTSDITDSYAAANLPAGLSVNAATGLISGTPITSGTYSVSLSATNSGGTGKATLSLTVAPNPAAGKVEFSASTYSVNEAAGTLTVYVNRTSGSSGAASVVCSTEGGTAKSGTDYTGKSETLSWTAGSTSQKSFTVAIKDAGITDGSTRTFSLKLASPTGADLGSPATATVTIKENDPTEGEIEFASSGYTVDETAGTVTVHLDRTVGTTGAVSVTCGTSGGTAKTGTDYTGKSSTISWASGDKAQKSFTVTIKNRGSSGGGGLKFSIVLSDPTGGAILGSPDVATVTIE